MKGRGPVSCYNIGSGFVYKPTVMQWIRPEMRGFQWSLSNIVTNIIWCGAVFRKIALVRWVRGGPSSGVERSWKKNWSIIWYIMIDSGHLLRGQVFYLVHSLLGVGLSLGVNKSSSGDLALILKFASWRVSWDPLGLVQRSFPDGIQSPKTIKADWWPVIAITSIFAVIQALEIIKGHGHVIAVAMVMLRSD